MERAHIPQLKYHYQNGLGDDSGCQLHPQFTQDYLRTLYTVASRQDGYFAHGLGGIIKEIYVTKDYVKFLSKDIFLQPDCTYVSRTVERAILGGNITIKLDQKLSDKIFNHCITQQLSIGHSCHPFLGQYIKYRQLNLPSQVGYEKTKLNFEYTVLNNLYKNINDTYRNSSVMSRYTHDAPYITDFVWNQFQLDNYSKMVYQQQIPTAQYQVIEERRLQPVRGYKESAATLTSRSVFGGIKTQIMEKQQQKKRSQYTNRNNQVKSLKADILDQVKKELEFQKQENKVVQLEQKIAELTKKEKLDNQIDPKKKPQELIDDYMNGQENITRALQQFENDFYPFKNISTKQIRTVDPSASYYTRRDARDNAFYALQNYDIAKMKKMADDNGLNPEFQNYEITQDDYDQLSKEVERLYQYSVQHARDNSLDPSRVPSKKKIRELIALDMWGSIAAMALPFIQKHGGKAIDYLSDKYVKPALSSLVPGQYVDMASDMIKGKFLTAPGGDGGFSWQDQNSDPTKGTKQSYSAAVNKFSSVDNCKEDIPQGEINSECVATVINPENYCFRIPIDNPRKVHPVSDSTQFQLTANASGNVAVNIGPFAQYQYYLANAATFAPTAGTNGAVWTQGPARHFFSDSAVELMRISAFSVELVCETNNNNNGNIQIAFNRDTISFATTAMDTYPITRASMVTSEAYQTGNGYTTYRFTLPYVPETEVFFARANASTNIEQPYFYILATGFNASSVIGVVNLNYCYEVTPSSSAQSLLNPQYPRASPETRVYITQMLSKFPAIQNMVLKDARQLSSGLMSKPAWNEKAINSLINQFLMRDFKDMPVRGQTYPDLTFLDGQRIHLVNNIPEYIQSLVQLSGRMRVQILNEDVLIQYNQLSDEHMFLVQNYGTNNPDTKQKWSNVLSKCIITVVDQGILKLLSALQNTSVPNPFQPQPSVLRDTTNKYLS